MMQRNEPIVSTTALCANHKDKFAQPCVACDMERAQRERDAFRVEVAQLREAAKHYSAWHPNCRYCDASLAVLSPAP